MTVSTTSSKVSYAGNGSTTAFAVGFYFLASADLKVTLRAADGTETVKTLSTHYTVSGAGNPSGGTVTMLTAPASGQTLVVSRNAPLTQVVDYQPNDPFPANTHEQALDKLTMITQQIQEQVDRSVKTSISDTITPDQLLTTITTSAANASASATAAAASATSAAASYDSFDDRYLGSKSGDPSVDNDGNALIAGAMYFNTAGSAMRVYNGSAWADVAQGVSFPYQTFSGNGSTTAFTLSSAPGSLGSIEVFIAGVRQKPSTDYTWASGTTLTFTVAPGSGTNNVFVRWVTTQAINVPADGSVTTAKIADANVTTAKIADANVTTAKLADANVTAAKLASGAARANFGAGAVLQVVSVTKTDTFTTGSGTPVDITGLSLNITPTSATSKILVLAQVGINSDTATAGYVNLVRNSTSLGVGTGGTTYNGTAVVYFNNVNAFTLVPIVYLDSPATTSSTTYKLQAFTGGGVGLATINRRGGDSIVGCSSTLTVMEIAA